MFPLLTLAGAVFFFGAALWAHGRWSEIRRIGNESTTWPSVQAQLAGKYVRLDPNANSTSEGSHWSPVVSYTYRVDDIEHFNNVIAASGTNFRVRDEAEAYVANYPTDTLQAHYNPANPGESVLEPGLPFAFHLLILLPIALVLAGLVILWAGVRAAFTGKT